MVVIVTTGRLAVTSSTLQPVCFLFDGGKNCLYYMLNLCSVIRAMDTAEDQPKEGWM